uniref:AlkB homolog 2, alpha-ketoglutarate dependent dioxygenase n=1 Tax=Sciurus vulgaris TaxID=55149 RepID=A0A8D2CMK4_SCIVU
MDRFLKGEEQEQTRRKGATLGEDEGCPRKRPRGETPGNATRLAVPNWRHIRAEGLDCDYMVLFGKAEADEIFQQLEEKVEYFAGTKMAVTTLGSIETTRENWRPGAPSPPSPLVPAGTSASGTRTPEGRAPAGGWRWSACSWPMEAY